LAQLFRRDVDAADLAREFEIARLVGVGLVQRLAIQQCLQLALALLARSRLLARLALRGFTFGTIGPGAQRERLREARLGRRARLARFRLALRVLVRLGFRRRLEAGLQQLIAQRFTHDRLSQPLQSSFWGPRKLHRAATRPQKARASRE